MTVFLPLGSAAGWFEGASFLESLALRLKTLLLTEEDIVVDPGGIMFRFASTTDSVEQLFPAGSVPWNRKDATAIGVVAAPGVVEMRMDWQPLLVGAGVDALIRHSAQRLAPPIKRALRVHIDSLSADANVLATLPGQARVRDAAIKHWILDAASASLENADMAIDPRAAPFVDAVEVAYLAGRPWQHGAFTLRFHDVRQWTWDGCVQFRQSRNGERLRAIVNELRAGTRAFDDVAQRQIDSLTGRDPERTDMVVAAWVPSAVIGSLIETRTARTNAGIWVIGAMG